MDGHLKHLYNVIKHKQNNSIFKAWRTTDLNFRTVIYFLDDAEPHIDAKNLYLFTKQCTCSFGCICSFDFEI